MTAQLRISPDIDTDALKQAVQSVEDNNRTNEASWSDWDDARHVAEAYGLELDAEGAQIIDRAIATNGASLVDDLPAVELAVWGQSFADSFWCRE